VAEGVLLAADFSTCTGDVIQQHLLQQLKCLNGCRLARVVPYLALLHQPNVQACVVVSVILGLEALSYSAC
jgi:hypothetical protein